MVKKKRILKAYYDTCGTCYSRIGFPKTKEGLADAEYLSEKIKSEDNPRGSDYANGGMFHGKAMGGIQKMQSSIEVYINYTSTETDEYKVVFDKDAWEAIIKNNK